MYIKKFTFYFISIGKDNIILFLNYNISKTAGTILIRFYLYFICILYTFYNLFTSSLLVKILSYRAGNTHASAI